MAKRPLKKDEQVTHFAIRFVAPILAVFLSAIVADLFSLTRWTGALVQASFWEYLP